MKGWRNNTWNQHFLVIIVCLFNVRQLIFLVCAWVEIVSRVRNSNSSLLHDLFLEIFILLRFQYQLFLEELLSDYWCIECPVSTEASFDNFSIHTLCFKSWLPCNCSHCNLPPYFVLLLPQFLDVFLSFLLYLWMERTFRNRNKRAVGLRIIIIPYFPLFDNRFPKRPTIFLNDLL